jgi:hypothetical protein
MKTRQEMIYEFMVALAPTYQRIQDDLSSNEAIDLGEVADVIYAQASSMANSYLENLS